jgi:DNA repair exonuclease SbcCD ATPase subunit
MKITLKNFRCYKDRIFTLPDTGLTLLSGVSGSGKSTLIKSVFYALYGKIKKPCSFGVNSCSVELQYKNVTIFRSTKPNILKVTIENTIYEDDAAQSYIDSFMGLTKDEFEISGYIAQKNSVCILSLPPLEQIKTIQTLSIQETVTTLKEKLKSLLKESNDELTKLATQLQFSKEEFSNCKKVECPEAISEDEIENNTKKLKELPDKIEALNTEKEMLLNKLNSIKNLEKELKASKSSKQQLEKEISEKRKIRSEIVNYNKPEDLKELELAINYLETKNEYENTLKQETEDKESRRIFLHKNIMDSDKVKELTIQLEYSKLVQKIGSKEDLQKNLNKLEKNRNELLNKLENADIMICPNCDSSLKLKNGVLEITDQSCSKSDKNKLKKEIGLLESTIAKVKNSLETLSEFGEIKIETDLEKIESLISKNKEYVSELNMLDSRFSKHLQKLIQKLESMTPIDGDLDQLKKRFADEQKRDILYKQYVAETKRIDADIMNLVTKIDANKSKLIMLESKLDKDSNTIESELNDTKYKLEFLNTEYKNELAKKEVYNLYRQKYDLFKNYEKWSKRVEKYTENHKEAENKHIGLLTIKEKYRQAEIFAVESTLNSINQHTQYYLDHFFPDDPMHVKLEIVNQTEIKTIINYKGYEYDSITQLSGGEFDRCVLASVCGVNTMMNCPMLFLDESLASLDAENNTDILGFLKELSTTKLIAVCSHEAIEGVFDSKVYI